MRPGVSMPLALALVLAAAGTAAAQGIRITGVSTAQYIDMRPMVLDSVPAGQATGSGSLKQTADGQIVQCLAGDAYCRYLRPASVTGAVPLIQDLNVSAWGLTTGLRAYAQLRFRAAEGDAAAFWANSDRSFQALSAYLELDRGPVLARVGRQWTTSGLGFYNFDGAMLSLRPLPWLTLGGYGGRGLVRGLNEPMTSSAISAVEPWAPDEPDWLFGAELRVRPSARFSAGVVYQRDIRSDAFNSDLLSPAGLYGERIAANTRVRLGASTVDGTLQTDLASGAVNDGRVRLELPRLFRIVPSLEARHYQPYFELWTIWGAFSPVGYDEASASGFWTSTDNKLSLRLSGGRRSYAPATGGMASLPLRNDGWRVSTDATLRPAPAWSVSAGYAADVGFGQARSDQMLSLRRELGAGYLGVSGMAFQTLDEFQVTKGRVWGASAEAGVQLLPGARLDGSFQAYRHAERYTGGIDWNQLRGMLQLQWTVGPEPGASAVTRGGAR